MASLVIMGLMDAVRLPVMFAVVCVIVPCVAGWDIVGHWFSGSGEQGNL